MLLDESNIIIKNNKSEFLVYFNNFLLRVISKVEPNSV